MDAILLAAGNSIRFGKNKLLYCLNGKPVYRYILEILYQQKKENLLEHVIVVSQYEEIFSDIRVHFPGIELVRNPAPERGISSSLRLGIERLEQLAGKSEACLFAVADQPRLTAESVCQLKRFWQEHTWGIAAASQGERIGNPVIFAERYYEELKALNGDVGGKRVLRRHMEDVGLCEIPVCELEDLDTPQDAEVWEEKRAADNLCIHADGEHRAERTDVTFLENSFPFLQETGHVVSIVGAGGKTTLMYILANCYARKGKLAVVTTTTHIMRPQNYPVAENKGELVCLLRGNRIVAAGTDAPGNKLKMPIQMGIADYMELADVVLVEADGAKHFPCKVPIDKEPVIPKESDIVLGVLGMDSVGAPLEKVCFRKEKAMELLKVDARHRLTEEDLAAILAADWGTRKGVEDRAYYVILNKCDTELRQRQGRKVQKLLFESGIENVICISLEPFLQQMEMSGISVDHK